MTKSYILQPIKHQSINFRGIGNIKLLNAPLTGFLCSRKCPAANILEAHNICKDWADDPSQTVISGFHSPVEQDCLRLLLRGQASIIHFPAREIECMRIRKDWQSALEQRRMLIVTLEEFKNRRMSRRETDRRNQVIAKLVQTLCIPYATPNGGLSELSPL